MSTRLINILEFISNTTMRLRWRRSKHTKPNININVPGAVQQTTAEDTRTGGNTPLQIPLNARGCSSCYKSSTAHVHDGQTAIGEDGSSKLPGYYYLGTPRVSSPNTPIGMHIGAIKCRSMSSGCGCICICIWGKDDGDDGRNGQGDIVWLFLDPLSKRPSDNQTKGGMESELSGLGK